jgi:cell division protein FtsW
MNWAAAQPVWRLLKSLSRKAPTMPRNLQPDRQLFGVTLALCFIGAVMVFSASAVTAGQQTGNGYTFLLRQVLWIAIGIAGMFWLMNTDYRKLRQPRVIFTALSVTLLLLIAVFFLDRSHATHRWIRLGPASFQPSELAKLVVVFFLAWFLEIRRKPRGFGINDPLHSLLPALGTMLVMAALVLAEPDMGTACMIFMIAFVMLYVSGLSLRYIFATGLAAIPAIYLLIVRVPYRYERAKSFFSPGADPQGHGFQLLQSLIAVGSGGFSGVGLMESRQKLFFLPEAHTDFIFAIICEELGYIGAVIVLLLFAMYGWRGFVAAMKAPDEFGRLLALGITTMVVGQAMVNLSVVLGLMPTKGIPLPFVSYGGSSLLGMLLATGVLLNISQHADES